MTQRILKLTKYGPLAASTRQRFDQYDPFLRAQGIETERRPLLDDDYLRRIYGGKRPRLSYLAARYGERLRLLIGRRDIDLLWIQYEAFPYLPGFAEWLTTLPRAAIVVDYDDAIFHGYDLHSSPVIRAGLGGKLGSLLKRADAVLCGNAYLAEYAGRYCDAIEVVPTVLDTEIFSPAPERRPDGPVTVGWIGTSSTWSNYLRPRIDLVLDALAPFEGRLLAVGGDRPATMRERYVHRDWNEAREVDDIRAMDIGIMPQDDTPWARGKCGYKLIQYMACAVPVIASPVGMNRDIVDHGVNGFLAETDDDWRVALRRLAEDADLRHAMGVAGRETIERSYSLARWGPRVAETLASIARGK